MCDRARDPLGSPRQAFPAELRMAANNKLKFTGLQRTFIPAQNCDLPDRYD